MEKPILFFSHSSKDSRALTKLKDILLQKTSNSIEVFLSSDGQSIPFGRNWVHKIEEALNISKIFFVFLTHNSIESKWVYFEAGHSYSKNMKVIPIGIFGVDLNTINPPLSLLQGFNIKDKNGLNNLISIINSNFSYSFNESFDDKDYNDLVQLDASFISNSFGNIFSSVGVYFPSQLSGDYGNEKLSSTFFSDFKKYLEEMKIEFAEYGEILNFEGAMLRTHIGSMLTNELEFNLLFDSISFPGAIDLMKNSLKIAYSTKSYVLKLVFNQNITCYTELHNLSSRLMKYDCHLTDKNDLRFQNIHFYIREYKPESGIYNLYIHFDIESFNIEVLQTLVDILFQSGVCVKQ